MRREYAESSCDNVVRNMTLQGCCSPQRHGTITMRIYIYIYIHIHTHTHIYSAGVPVDQRFVYTARNIVWYVCARARSLTWPLDMDLAMSPRTLATSSLVSSLLQKRKTSSHSSRCAYSPITTSLQQASHMMSCHTPQQV
jgi:hypothetical protein